MTGAAAVCTAFQFYTSAIPGGQYPLLTYSCGRSLHGKGPSTLTEATLSPDTKIVIRFSCLRDQVLQMKAHYSVATLPQTNEKAVLHKGATGRKVPDSRGPLSRLPIFRIYPDPCLRPPIHETAMRGSIT